MNRVHWTILVAAILIVGCTMKEPEAPKPAPKAGGSSMLAAADSHSIPESLFVESKLDWIVEDLVRTYDSDPEGMIARFGTPDSVHRIPVRDPNTDNLDTLFQYFYPEMTVSLYYNPADNSSYLTDVETKDLALLAQRGIGAGISPDSVKSLLGQEDSTVSSSDRRRKIFYTPPIITALNHQLCFLFHNDTLRSVAYNRCYD